MHAEPLLPLLDNSSPLLADFTISLILQLKALLGITTRVLRSSKLDASVAKADLLASLCKQIGDTAYVSPLGSKEYMDESDAFEQIGVSVQYYEFKHPEYPQPFGEFLPYMSIIDMLFNCGERSPKLIRGASELLQ